MVWLLALWLAPVAPAQVPDVPSDDVIQNVLDHEEQLLQAVKDNNPEHHRRLLQLKEHNRGEYLFALLRVAKLVSRAKADPAFAERARQIMDLERQLQEMARGFGALSKSDQRARRAELQEVAGQLMDLKQTERRARLEELRARIAEFETDIEARDEDRAEIIETYVDQLIQEPVEL